MDIKSNPAGGRVRENRRAKKKNYEGRQRSMTAGGT